MDNPLRYNIAVAGKESNKNQKLAVLFAFVLFQILFFPFDTHRLGWLMIPLPGSLAFFLSVIAAILTLKIAFNLPKDSRGNYANIALAVSGIFALMSIFRANLTDRLILGLGSVGWGILSLYLVSLKSKSFGSFGELVLVPANIFFELMNSGKRILGSLSHWAFESSKPRRSASKFLLGILITVPVSGILLMLLSMADPIFGYYTKNILTMEFLRSEMFWNLTGRFIFSLLGLVAIASLVNLKITRQLSPLTQVNKQNKNILFPLFMLSLVTSLILAAFLFIQFRYIFLLQNLSDLGMFGIHTFSDYVKKGFFELLLVTFIIYFISGIGLILYRNFKPGGIYLAVNSTLITLNFILSISVFRRIYLYVNAHGLTTIRFYGIALLLIVMLLLFTLILRYLRFKNKLYLLELVGVSVILFSFSTVNSDYLIGKYAPPTVNGQIDRNYLAGLSPDGYKLWDEVIANVQKDALLISQTPYSLDDKIAIVRSYWAINRIRQNFGRLERIYKNPSLNTMREFNLKEYGVYRNLKATMSLEELEKLEAMLRPTANYLLQNQEIPRDIYQFFE